jgi:hypothetical protein
MKTAWGEENEASIKTATLANLMTRHVRQVLYRAITVNTLSTKHKMISSQRGG